MTNLGPLVPMWSLFMPRDRAARTNLILLARPRGFEPLTFAFGEQGSPKVCSWYKIAPPWRGLVIPHWWGMAAKSRPSLPPPLKLPSALISLRIIRSEGVIFRVQR
jgi:hypothetical protein